MRKRIFLILFAGIGLFTIFITMELVFFFKQERAHLIDQQVEVLATSLLATGIFESRFEEMQAQVSKALGTRETIAFLSIYDSRLNLRFRNPNAQILFGAQVIEPKEKWMTLAYGPHKLRLLNIRTQGVSSSWIQVGLLLDQQNAEWESLAARAFFIVTALLVGVAIASYFLSKALLLPLAELAKDLRSFSQDFERKQSSSEIFKKWSLKAKDKDSFSELVDSLVELRSRLSERLKMNEGTLSQMAHEFRTPLSVIRAGTESLLMEAKTDEQKEHLSELLNEADRLSETISSFLDWSRMQQSHTETLKLSNLSLTECLEALHLGFEVTHPGRVILNANGFCEVKAYRPHLEQVISNLISNALKYSPQDSQVNVEQNENKLTVTDRGTGIPERVLQRLGEPFNAGVSAGTGLGLAWVKTLCERYGWTLRLDTEREGTRVEIIFT